MGEALARRSDVDFSDLDQAVEEEHRVRTGETKSCREIYRNRGAPYFRLLEQQTLERIVMSRNGVIALGGGALMGVTSPETLLEESFCVLLSVDRDVLYERILRGGVPAFFDSRNPRESFEKLYAERMPSYRLLADLTVDNTDRPVEAVADDISAALDGYPFKEFKKR